MTQSSKPNNFNGSSVDMVTLLGNLSQKSEDFTRAAGPTTQRIVDNNSSIHTIQSNLTHHTSYNPFPIKVVFILYDITIYIGILGNGFAFLVLLSKEMSQQPGTFFLQALTLVDVVVLVLSEIFFRRRTTQLNAVACKLSIFLPAITNFYSKYILVLLNIDRFIAVFFPLKWKSSISYSTRVKMLLILLILGCLIFAYRLYSYSLTNNLYIPCMFTRSKQEFLYLVTNVNIVLNNLAALLIAFFSSCISVKLWCESKETADMVSEDAQKRNKQKVIV